MGADLGRADVADNSGPEPEEQLEWNRLRVEQDIKGKEEKWKTM